jgi:endonuclease/exonuclease/phosphatase family metal-dependent hydrolase
MRGAWKIGSLRGMLSGAGLPLLRSSLLVGSFASVSCFSTGLDSLAPLHDLTEGSREGTSATGGRDPEFEGPLRVLSLNLAHGRADGPHQLLQSAASRRATLSSVAELLQRERPHVVGLQEVDGPSFWSGGFCHLERLASLTGLRFGAHGEHVFSRWLRYGTGLLSSLRLRGSDSFTFDPSPPTFSKGFTFGTLALSPGREVDLVSVHLDFSRTAVRLRQVDQMVDVLARRGRPLIIMGDFNASWDDPDSAVRSLATRLELTAHEPQASPRRRGVRTFPASQRRLDWILISQSLSFEHYEVLADVVSDHLPIVADIRWR